MRHHRWTRQQRAALAHFALGQRYAVETPRGWEIRKRETYAREHREPGARVSRHTLEALWRNGALTRVTDDRPMFAPLEFVLSAIGKEEVGRLFPTRFDATLARLAGRG